MIPERTKTVRVFFIIYTSFGYLILFSISLIIFPSIISSFPNFWSILGIVILFSLSIVVIFPGYIVLNQDKHDWQKELEIYQEYLKYYTEQDLRNHSEYYIITNKKILINSKWNLRRDNKKITEIKNVIELNKDFLIININYLSKVRFDPNLNRLYFKLKLHKKFRALLKAEKYGGHNERAMSFSKISDDEYTEILKTLFNLVPHLKIETESLHYPDDDFLIG